MVSALNLPPFAWGSEMITPQEMRRRKEERPFRPFGICLRDGRQFDIPDLTWYLVGASMPSLLVRFGSWSLAERGMTLAMPPKMFFLFSTRRPISCSFLSPGD
jgi:hypothetical protein